MNLKRWLVVLIAAAGLGAGVAQADPGVDVTYNNGFLRVSLQGSYAGARYLIWRSGELAGQFDPLDSQTTLCTGECYTVDLRADPGQTYYYRFDLYYPDDSRVSYGPFAVTVPNPPLGVRLWPNPVRANAQVELTLPGSRFADPVTVDARVVDLRGRTLRVLQSGLLYRGSTPLLWDGRDQAGNRLRPGTYFVQLRTSIGTTALRFVAL